MAREDLICQVRQKLIPGNTMEGQSISVGDVMTSVCLCVCLCHTLSLPGDGDTGLMCCVGMKQELMKPRHTYTATHTHTQPFQALTLQLEDTNTRILDSLVLTVMLMQMLRQALLFLWGSCMNFRFFPYWEGLLTVPSNMCHYNSNDRILFR